MNVEQILYVIIGILAVINLILAFAFFSKSKDAAEISRELKRAQIIADELEKRIKEASENEDELEAKISSLRENTGALGEVNRALQSQISYLKETIESGKNELAAAVSEKNALEVKLAQTSAQIAEKEESFKAQQANFIEVKERLNAEFQSLAGKILEEKSQNFAKNNQTSLDLILKPLKEKIESFEKRVNDVHTEAVKNSVGLEAQIKNVLNIGAAMSSEAKELVSALKGGNKLAGSWGEMQLEASLQASGLIKNESYLTQENFVSGEGKRQIPDVIVKVPGGKHIIIDSKVSLVAYERAVSAMNEGCEDEARAQLKLHAASVKAHVEELCAKDYGALAQLKSPDFVLMFMPIEAAYIEAMRADGGLFSYAYDKRVVIVSHATLMPILRTVANLWRIERGNDEAKAILKSATAIYNNVCTIAENLRLLGGTLNTAATHYNKVVTNVVGQQGIYGKVRKFRELSNQARQGEVALGELNAEFEVRNLSEIAQEDLSAQLFYEPEILEGGDPKDSGE